MAVVNIDNKEINIDDECMDLVSYFNDVGLKTFSCCSGHDKLRFNIIFDNSITDEDISNFLKDKVNKYNHSMFLGKFVKWSRVISGEIKLTWMYEAENIMFAKIDYDRIIKKGR